MERLFISPKEIHAAPPRVGVRPCARRGVRLTLHPAPCSYVSFASGALFINYKKAFCLFDFLTF